MESAVILAGGKSTRMGSNKALLDFGGETLIARVHRILRDAFREVLISANDAETYAFLGAPIVHDVFDSAGSLAGIHAGLLRCRADRCFVAACDMPFLNTDLVRYLGRLAGDFDVVIPVSRNGLEPLHAFYSRRCVPHIGAQLKRGNPKIIDFFDKVRVREVSLDEIAWFDPEGLSCLNINTREKYESARKKFEEQTMR